MKFLGEFQSFWLEKWHCFLFPHLYLSLSKLLLRFVLLLLWFHIWILLKFYIVPLNHLFESMIFCPEVWRYLFHKVSIFSQHLNLCIEFFDFILKVSYCLFHFKELLFLWFKLTLTLFISSYLLVQFTAIGSQLIVNFLQRVTLLFFVICFLPIYICFIF